METIKLQIYGGGGHARVIAESWQETGGTVVAVADDDRSITQFLGMKTVHPNELVHDIPLIVGIGKNMTRESVVSRLQDYRFGIVIHPSAVISRSSFIGIGTVVMAAAVVNANTTVGYHAIINTAAIVEHDCNIGDFVHAAPGCVICGGVSIGAGTLIGAGAIVLPGKRVGRGCTVGAGSVVIDDVPDGVTVLGVPARKRFISTS